MTLWAIRKTGNFSPDTIKEPCQGLFGVFTREMLRKVDPAPILVQLIKDCRESSSNLDWNSVIREQSFDQLRDHGEFAILQFSGQDRIQDGADESFGAMVGAQSGADFLAIRGR